MKSLSSEKVSDTGSTGLDSEHSWILRAQKGDQNAFNALFRCYYPKILKFTARQIGCKDAANDVTQDVFMKAHTALGSFRGESRFYTWLYRIAFNATHTYLRVTQKSPVTESLSELSPVFLESKEGGVDSSSPEKSLLDWQAKNQLQLNLVGLSPLLFKTIYLREVKNLSYASISLLMNCPIGTIRSRIARARGFMKKNRLH